eukprot:Skav221839  [mRNA]  locus=scaffold885:463742:465520:+ [translate_table: standard]
MEPSAPCGTDSGTVAALAVDGVECAPCGVISAPSNLQELKDGGGLVSTLDWQLPPPEAWRDQLGPVRAAIWRALPPGAAVRWDSLPLEAPMFTAEEVAAMRSEVCAALGIDPCWAEQSFELTPYKFNLLEAIATRLGDLDAGLCAVLKEGAPTGVGAKIPASGVWPRLDTDDPVEGTVPDLVLCASNHRSADELAKVRALVEKELEQGYMQRVGSLAQVKQRFPSDKLAIGKLGVVSCDGKEDRLIGDSRASGASPAAQFSERAEVPSLYHFSAALDRFAEWNFKRGNRANPVASSEAWCLFSIDIKGAHKSVRTHPDDVGLAVFQVEGEHFAYVNNHFGASWSAYWWSRLSALLLRIMRHTLRHCHVGGVYVDDFLWLLPRETAPLMASLLTALLQVLKVPISWRKLAFGRSLSYVGWKLSLIGGFSAQLPSNKQEKLLQQVQRWITHPRRVSREDLSKLLGLLIWATQVKLTLRPFLAPLFSTLHRPSQKLQCAGLQQIDELVQLLDSSLVLTGAAKTCDAQAGWRLSSVGSLVVRDQQQARQLLEQPRLKNGKVWLRFKAWSPTVDLDKAAVRSLQVLRQSLRANQFNP